MKQIRLFLILSIIAAACPLSAQDGMDEVLSAIEQNNTTLKAYRETMKADKLANRTELFLSDPEIGFNYLWGNPSSTGNRQDVSISQTIDLSFLTGMKHRLAGTKNELVEWQYMADRMDIMLEAKQLLIDLTYYNGLLKELSTRREHAEAIARDQKRRLDEGDANILEYNNACLNLSKVHAEIQRMETERNTAEAQLARLNGGRTVRFANDCFERVELPKDFDEWFAAAESRNPILAYVRSEVELSKKQLSLNRQENLPSFSVGYASEKTQGQRYQGISFGISVPLWSNRNRVRQARAAVVAAEARQSDATTQCYARLHILYRRVSGLQETANTYRRALTEASNSQLLKKALDVGEISVLDYVVQAGLYYDSVDKALSAERDYQKAFAELMAFEL